MKSPKENIGHLNDGDMAELLHKISLLTSEDLCTVMTAISTGLIRQRDIASNRAVDFESAVSNVARLSTITPERWAAITERFIKPHEEALRNPGLLDSLAKRSSGSGTKTVAQNKEK